jgi:ectoine hydroxylase-related dioxygenase (phytanoyl-CoA dioxygenase family)
MMLRYGTAVLVLSCGSAFVSRPNIPPLRLSSSLYNAPAPGLYEEQETLLVNRGVHEEGLMANNHSPIKTNKIKGAGSGGGFGGSPAGGRKAGFKVEAKAHAKVLQKDGVVRIDGVLTNEMADTMRDFVLTLRAKSEEDIKAGTVRAMDRFANVLLRHNRCDLKIPLGSTEVNTALHHVLCQSPVRQTIEELLTPNAVLYELASLISDPGSQRQVVHPDNPCSPDLKDTEPVLLTCFMALQDIDMSMGPTVWLPKTHTLEAHTKFRDETVGAGDAASPKDTLLRTTPSVLGILPKGSCAIFDSRLLHCGSANQSGMSRALFYFSFKNPRIGYPGNPASIISKLGAANLSIKSLAEELDAAKSGKVSSSLLGILSGH